MSLSSSARLAFDDRNTGLIYWLAEGLSGLFFSPPHITSWKKSHQKCSLIFLSIHFLCLRWNGIFFPAALAMRARTVTPPPKSCIFSHFYSCNDPIMQVLIPSYKGRKLGPKSLGHLLKVTQLLGRIWGCRQDQPDPPPHQIAS